MKLIWVSPNRLVFPTLIKKCGFAAMSHSKARCEVYPGSKDIKRFPVPDDKVSWKVDWPEYKPVDYTADVVTKQPPWADIDVRSDKAGPLPKYNEIDGKVDRRSFEGKYDVVDRVPSVIRHAGGTGFYKNPIGRTGIVGRGLLGRWGPNHAADPIVTRWKRNQSGEIEKKGGLQVLEFVAIKRRDNGAWAIPGGMVEPGDNVSATLKKEFGEEAMNFLEASDDEKQQIEEQIGKLFHGGEKIYEGYVDDPRNTDNSWMETVAMNFHDATGEACGKIKLHAGDDAGDVSWKEISKDLQLFASHQDFVKRAAERHNAAY